MNPQDHKKEFFNYIELLLACTRDYERGHITFKMFLRKKVKFLREADRALDELISLTKEGSNG